ncbi:hypothetical protein LPTSP3_g21090 [Leptospira kobayashii]|uniref:Glycosyltransferase RgtA/B/C/D-like domain-containing protein n=1 Tax=Leptospira kobayashii TaxID=1917830 RepID=A0ABN6KFK7_9LEPT|nr:hypothetical protein [Leptospira kobayashii]BDA79179.1 hypothetical protein LPTSP3_g21090 [Leptospira kobayashii]
MFLKNLGPLTNGRFYMALLALPFLLLGMLLYTKTLPEFAIFHVLNYDPEYIYLLNGLSYALYEQIGYIDHPGTPTIVIISYLIQLKYFLVSTFFPDRNVVEDLIRNSDQYLHFINIFIVTCFSLLLSGFGIYIYRKTNNLLLAVFYQIVNLQSSVYIVFLPRMTSEYFVIIASTIISFLLYLIFLRKEKDRFVLILLFAGFTGFALAIKILFLPVIILVFLISYKYYRDYFTILAIMIAVFFISISPVLDKLQVMYEWFSAIFTHTAVYGSGENRVFDFSMMLKNFIRFVRDEKFFFAIFAFNSAFFVKAFLSYFKNGKSRKDRDYLMFSGAVLICIGCFMVQALKHYAGGRYFIPAFHLNAILIVINLAALEKTASWMQIRYAVAGLILLLLAARIFDYRALLEERTDLYADWRKMQSIQENLEKNSRIYNVYQGYNYESSFAFGNHYTKYANGVFTPHLKKVFGMKYLFWGGDRGFADWDYKNMQSLEEVRKSYKGKIYIIGTFVLENPNFKYRLIENNKVWYVYEILD